MSEKKCQELTEKQKQFAVEYLVDFNATAAAKRAGYSAKTASAAASRLLTNVKVQQLIKQEQDKLFERTEIKVEDILENIACIAFYDVNDYIQLSGDGNIMSLKDISSLTKKQRKAVKSIKNGKYGIEIEFDSRTKALEMLMDYYNVGKGAADENDDKEEITGIVMMPAREEKPSDQDLLAENGEYIQV